MKNNIKGKAAISINAPVSKVWEALTKPEIIKKYFFNTNTSTDWKPGNPIIFKGEWQGKSYEDKGTVLNYEHEKLIRYNYWSSMSGIEDKPENYVIITYKLSQENNRTHLTITQENIPDEKTRIHSEENWNQVLQGLKNLMETETLATAHQ